MATLWLALAVGALAAVIALAVTERYQRRRTQARAYLRGVRSMLSGDRDAAIEALSSAARLASREAIETYLALGALFRRTGDLARAVRLHRNMLLGPALDPSARAEIERELAEDYRRSGMLRESAEIYARLAEGDRRAAEGLRDVLVEAGELARAAEVQRSLGGGGRDPLLAHLLAACAREALPREPARAREIVARALEADPESADALLAAAEVAGVAGGVDEALGHLSRALANDRRAAALAWPAVAAIPDRAAALEAIGARAAAHPDDAGLACLHGRLLAVAGRTAEAYRALSRALRGDPSGEVVQAVREVLRDAAASDPEDLAARHDLLIQALLARARPIRCGRCGADAPARAWRCRRCGAFDPY